MKNEFFNRTKPVIFIVLISIIAEIYVFNINYWKTVTFSDPYRLDLSSIGITGGDVHYTDNKWELDLSQGDVILFIPVTEEVKTIGIHASSESPNALAYYRLIHSGDYKEIYSKILRTTVYYVENNGAVSETEDISFAVNSDGESLFWIGGGHNGYAVLMFTADPFWRKESVFLDSLTLNEKYSLRISLPRCLVLFVLLMFLYYFRPGSKLWMIPVKDKKYVVPLAAAVAFFAFILLGAANPLWWGETSALDSYGELTKALAKGQLYVDLVPSEELMQMDNPYDYDARKTEGVEYYLDYAYYDGHYYVYFGIVPALVMLPFYLVFGKIPSYLALYYIVLGLYLSGLALVLYAYLKRYAQKDPEKSASVAEFVLLYFLWVLISFIPALYYADFSYLFPQVFAMAFLVFGIYFYMDAGTSSDHSCRKIALGSVCMALIAGCRPHIILYALLAYPLLRNKMCKRNTAKMWAAFFIPFAVTAIPLMIYNYARFGNVADFGVYYNLTVGNIYDSHFGFSFEKWKEGMYYYLFSPWNFKNGFPWFRQYDAGLSATNVTDSIAGYFAMFPTALLPLLYWPFQLRKLKKDQKMAEQFLMSGIIILVSFVNIYVASLFLKVRYVFDFATLLGLTSVICIHRLYGSEKYKNMIRSISLIFIIQSAFTSFLYIFNEYLDLGSLYYCNRDFWYHVRYLMEFWIS